MTYLSRLGLNLRSRQVQRDLAQPYQMHRTIMRAFPTPLPREERVLFRLEQTVARSGQTLLVQSQSQPDWGRLNNSDYLLPPAPLELAKNPDVKQFEARFQVGQQLFFRLLANPTIKRNGKRYGLYGEEAQLHWLERKAQLGGFHILELGIGTQNILSGRLAKIKNGHRLRMVTVQYDGRLQVKDPGRLLAALRQGIGSGKGFGCGLLSLARC